MTCAVIYLNILSMKPANHRGIFRPRNVAIDDARSPMLRLLTDCNNKASGMIEVDYAQQWQTLIKAIRFGYVDDRQRLTDAGRKFLEKNHGA